MDILEKLRRAIFGIVVVRRMPVAPLSFNDAPDRAEPIARERIEADLVVMSMETEREIMRADYRNETGVISIGDKSTPRRVFGVRIAYDNTLGLGEFLVSEKVYRA